MQYTRPRAWGRDVRKVSLVCIPQAQRVLDPGVRQPLGRDQWEPGAKVSQRPPWGQPEYLGGRTAHWPVTGSQSSRAACFQDFGPSPSCANGGVLSPFWHQSIRDG